MKEKIESLKSAIESIDEDHVEVVAALERLEDDLPGDLIFPGEASLEKTISESVEQIESDIETASDDFLSQKWAGLVKELEKWESDHPSITLRVGDIARALAISGL